MRDRHRQRPLATILALAFIVALPRLAAYAQHPAQAQTSPESARWLAAKAMESLERGENDSGDAARLAAYREGLRYAQAAVSADEENADAHFAAFANRGRIMELEGAIASFFNLRVLKRELNRTLELNPNHADALAAKGRMLRKLPRVLGGNLEEAAQYLRRAIDLDRNAVSARIELAEIYRDLGHPEVGIPYLENAAEIARRDGKFDRLAEIQSQLQLLSSGSSAALNDGR